MNGYIGVTSREWFTYLASEGSMNEINFWRKNTNTFKILSKGDTFFFLVKNDKGIKGERTVIGKAKYERFEVLTVRDAWDKYQHGNGDETKESFIFRMKKMFNTDELTGQLGCIILSHFVVFDNPVLLSEINIDFKNSVVSGKGISESQVNLILEQGINSSSYLLQQVKEFDDVGFTEDDEGFPEGKHILKQHLVRERNPKVIQQAKNLFSQQHGKLFCEVCGFDFKEHYGDVGEGYIEGHHTKPISEMVEREVTMVEDIALVCANCHRMLHRKRPWLSIDKLRELVI